jgi:hypothetical protein
MDTLGLPADALDLAQKQQREIRDRRAAEPAAGGQVGCDREGCNVSAQR